MKPHFQNPHIKCNQNRRIRRANCAKRAHRLKFLIAEHHRRSRIRHNSQFVEGMRVEWRSNKGEVRTGIILETHPYLFGELGVRVALDPKFHEKDSDNLGLLFASAIKPCC